jgi:hypothetical protein
MHPDRLGELDNQISEVEAFIERQRQLIAGLKAKRRPTERCGNSSRLFRSSGRSVEGAPTNPLDGQ